MCHVTLKGRKSSDEWRDRLGLVSIGNCIQRGRHVKRMDKDNCVKNTSVTVSLILRIFGNFTYTHTKT